MDLNKLSVIVSLMIALSVASERLVSIIKGLIPFLNQEQPDATKEGWRASALQALAVVSGVVTALLARPIIAEIVPGPWNNSMGIIAIGLLASGGSGFWHSVQGYVNQVKDVKKLEVEARKIQTGAARVPPGP